MDRLGSAFVGRQTELAELEAALEDLLSGQARLFMLAGEPGVGKSRTAQEFASYALPGHQRLLGKMSRAAWDASLLALETGYSCTCAG